MIIVRLQGGLGNQLFQYALGRSLALHTQAALKLDLSSFSEETTNTKRDYRLDRFAIQAEIATHEERRALTRYRPKSGRFGALWNSFFADESRYIQEKTTSYDPRIKDSTPPVYLDGWWQTEKYFVEHENEIRKEVQLRTPFTVPYDALAEQLARIPSPVAVHVRRGDFVTHPDASRYHQLCTPEYYKEAFSILSKHVTNPTLCLFSDDMDWVLQNIALPFPHLIMSHATNDECQELMLMKACKHAIIANSSFSWWGAWLNPTPDKVVIAPSRWVTKDSWNSPDRLPTTWITIPA